MSERTASRTAVLVCQGRAVADGRLCAGLFRDPIASQLLTSEERPAVDRARSDEPPATMRERLVWERLRACAEGIVPRTVVVDEAVAAAGHRQVVIVGAGLDTRPWRLADLRDATVFCVDHPASQADCRTRADGLQPVCEQLRFVAVDLGRGSLEEALGSAGHDSTAPTTWLWEGVVPYLTRVEVEATLAGIAGRSTHGSAIVVQYQDRSVLARLGRRVGGFVARRSGIDDPLAGEPWRSLWRPGEMSALLARHGFAVDQDEDLLTVAQRIGSPTTRRRSLADGRVVIAVRS